MQTDQRNTTHLICPLTGDDARTMREQMHLAARTGASMVECRLDMLATPPSENDLHWLLANAPLPVIATCRPKRQGGRYDGEESRRLEILRLSARLGATFCDMEDDVPTAHWPVGRVIVSHHDFAAPPADLPALMRRLEATPAEVVKVAFAAVGPDDALLALDAVRAARKPAIVLAMGEAGTISRVLAGKVGAFGTFASLEAGAESAPGQPTLRDFIEMYRWNEIRPGTPVYGVIACPVAHSMSPAIHNAAFAAAGLPGVYLPLLVPPDTQSFNRFLDGLRARGWLDVRGLSVTIPHKENALAYVGPGRCDELTRKIGAVNTITFERDGRVSGTNTDYPAAIDALCGAMGISRDALAGRKVAVLGAGGVARAIVAALTHCRADVTICNRTLERAIRLAADFACQAAPLEAESCRRAEIIVNCTSAGMHPNVEASPIAAISSAVRVVFDTIYNPVETKLLRLAREAGCTAVAGVEMFVNQAAGQFDTWTGQPASRDAMRQVVLRRLGGK